MKRAITIGAVCLGIVAMGVPAANAGNGNGGRAAVAKECAKMKKADKAAFKAVYGKHAMRKCIKGEPLDTDESTPGEFKNAAKECRAERQADSEAFQETYGTNANKRNAFGKCVSGKVKHTDEEPEPEEPELPEAAA
jgi:hypothetical protein